MTEFTRFYNYFKPDHYHVYLDINRKDKYISGETLITGEALTTEIALHQKDLVIESLQVEDKILTFKVDNHANAIHFSLPKVGQVTLKIKYTAPLTDTMMGIYPSYYEIDGEKKQIIGTQFETNFARQAFPCIDEPEAKATFDLAIKFDEQPDETVLANTPELRVENSVHYFDTTVKMSTYLVAFAFGELQNKQTETRSGVKVGVYATKSHDPKTLDFALDIAKRSIEFFEDFYQTPYPLAQSNQLALPDFSAGAMENWGLVTYREAYLVVDPDNTALETKQVVATVIAHELAHQWFGDLVTMKWWDDLWLNESFANMMEYVAIDALEPDWHIWELFQTSDVPAALHRDATDGVQAVHVQVNHPAEIDSLFDAAIVYAKGARMLVMVRALIGDNALRQGLKTYFAAHKYGNATGADLWQALGDASGQDVAAVMNSWLEQPGYPVVSAEVLDGQLTLTQKQFFIGKGQDDNRLWQIPVNSNYEAVPKIMTEQKVVLGDYVTLRREAVEAFYLNMSNDSHFIVKYDNTLLQDILVNIAQQDATTQRQIIQDLHILAQGQQIAFSEIVPLLIRFANSDSKIVIDALYAVTQDLRQFVTLNSDEENNLKRLYDQLSRQQFERLGWHAKNNESLDDELTRPYIVSAALYSENSIATQQAHDLFKTYESDLQQLPAEIRVFIIRNEVQNYGNQPLFDDLLLNYRQTSDASYKQDLRAAMTSVTDPTLVSQLVATFKNADVIKPQDLRGWFGSTLRNAHGEQAAWDWLRQEWDWLETTVGGDMEFTTYITVAASVLKTRQRLEEFKDFFNPKSEQPGLTREIKMDIRVISSRVVLIESEKDAVNQVIAANI